MKNKKGSLLLQFVLIIICITLGFLTGFFFSQNFITQSDQIFNKPMLLLQNDGWGQNANDTSKVLFAYFIYNFADVEAKNVSVVCEIGEDDELNNLLRSQTFNIGNIASNSYEYQESNIKYITSGYDYGYCHLKTDENYIDLSEKINK
jgi:hypothetical protein